MHKQWPTQKIPLFKSRIISFCSVGLMLLGLFWLAPNNAFSAQEVSQQVSQAQLKKLKQNINKINSWLTHANSEKTGLSKQLENQDKEIDHLSRDIRFNNAKITKHTSQLKKLNKQLRKQRAALSTQKTFLIKQIKTAYFHGKQSPLKRLLDTDNPQDFARQMKYFTYFNDAREEKISAFQNSLKSLQETETKVLLQNKNLNEQKLSLKTNLDTLKVKRTLRQKILNQLESKIKTKSQRLAKMKADQTRLKELLDELEVAIANIPLPIDASPFYKQKNKLPWPSRGKVLARFGSRIAQGKLRLNGIHIATKEDDPVKSVHYGRVIFANWIRGFGLLIIIDHGDNYMSLYGNNKSLIKETGDWVRAKEVIAYSAQSKTNKESGLYFEIRKKGKPLNPNQWLSK